LEAIFIDAGSTDNTFDILEKFKKKFSLIEILPHLTQVEAINYGIKKATGLLVGWQNTDDLYAKNTFNEISNLYKKNPDCMIFTGDISLIDTNGIITKRLKYITPNYFYLVSIGMVMASQSTFWKKIIHNEVGFLDIRLNFSFDYEWFIRITKKYKVVHINKVLGYFRLHNESKSHLEKNKFDQENDFLLTGHKKYFFWIIRYYFLKILRLLDLTR
jgi:glycosyltransferase involved in cell wall biosynthesis